MQQTPKKKFNNHQISLTEDSSLQEILQYNAPPP